MNILLITAHASPQSFTHRIVKRFQELAQDNQNNEVYEMDLYDTQWWQENYRYASEKQQDFLATRKRIQEKISWADELIFIHPLWWGGKPAVMKNWIDANLNAGYAFKYVKKPRWQRMFTTPVGLLHGKTAKVYVTGDGHWLLYLLVLFPFFNIWLIFIFNSCGLKPRSLRYFGSMRWRSERNKEKLLNSISL